MIVLWIYLGLGACMFFGVLGYLMYKTETPEDAQGALWAAVGCGLLWPAVCVGLFLNWRAAKS